MTSKKLTIFIGFDPVESISFYTLIHSITHFASQPVFIVPLNIRNLNSHFYRERDPKQSNEFSFTRFLVPYLMDFQGWALFMDCDMMLREDIFNIFEEIKNQEEKAVYVVKHDYDVKEGLKYLNTIEFNSEIFEISNNICSPICFVNPYGDSAFLTGEFSVTGNLSASPYTVHEDE